LSEKKKVSVIVADDELHIRALIKTVMKSMQAEIAGEAKNGQEAIDLFRSEKPNLLLLDINMPVKDGEQALKEIIDEFPDAFVIMLTSVSDMGTVKKCLDNGAANYILKDTPLNEIKKIIKETWDSFKESKGIKNDSEI